MRPVEQHAAIDLRAAIDFRAVRVLVLVMLICVALVAPMVSRGAQPSAAGDLLALDTFSRTSQSGWRSADDGGRYVYPSGLGGFAVDGRAGTLRLAQPGQGRSAQLAQPGHRDVDVRFRVSMDRAPSGGGVVVAALLRHTADGTEYRARVRVTRSGTVWLSVVRMRHGAATLLGQQVRIDGLRAVPGTPIWLRARIRGAAPTQIQVKAWAAGSCPARWLGPQPPRPWPRHPGRRPRRRACLPVGHDHAPARRLPLR